MSLSITQILSRLDNCDMVLYDDISNNTDDKKQLDKNISWLIPQ